MFVRNQGHYIHRQQQGLQSEGVLQAVAELDDDAWCKEMVQLAVQGDPESDSQQTDDDIIRQFCNGTGIFAD
jgi:hypothetical protein